SITLEHFPCSAKVNILAGEAKLGSRAGRSSRPRPRRGQRCKMPGFYAAVYLHDEGSREGAPARCQSPRRHLAVVLFRRQDRRAWIERRRQELAAEDHVRRGYELHWRSVSGRANIDRAS